MSDDQFDQTALEVTRYFECNDAHHPARESADDIIKHAEQLRRSNAEILAACEEGHYLFASGVSALTCEKENRERHLEESNKITAQIDAAIAKAKSEVSNA